MPSFMSSIRGRLFAFIIVMLAILGAIAFWNSQVDRSRAVSQVQDDILTQAYLVAAAHNQLIENVEDLLIDLSTDATLRDFDSPACAEAVERMTLAHAAYSNMSVLDLDGVIRCSTDPEGIGVSLGDREYVRTTRATGALTSSGYIMARAINKPIAIYALPLLATDGEQVGTVLIGIDLGWFNRFIEEQVTRSDVQTTIIGTNGLVLSRVPADDVPTGAVLPGDSVGDRPWAQEILQATAPIQRELDEPGRPSELSAIVPLEFRSGMRPGYVVVTTPKEPALATANANFRKELLILAGIAGISLLWGWGLSTYSVHRPVRALLHAAGRYARGDFGARVGISRSSSSEMRGLAEALESMAGRIAEGQETLRRNATVDPLTGLPNRAETERLIDLRFEQDTDRHCTLVEVQLRQFGRVNATFGFAGGDTLLGQIGPRLIETFGEGTLVGRTGGDEFMVLLPDHDPRVGGTDVTTITVQLDHAFEEPFILDAEPVYLSARASLARYPKDGATAKALTRRASLALGRAKASGHGVVAYDATRDEPHTDQLKILAALREALRAGALELYYQPQVDLQRREIAGAEVLMRWQREDGSFVPPAEFIVLAEQTGYIRILTTWALETASRQVHEWHKAGLPVRVSVNLSAADFEDADLARRLTSITREWTLPEGTIDLEITETAILADTDEAVSTCEALLAAGVTLAIDDFGTGYSPFVYLQRLPISSIKIDQSFVRDMLTNPKAREIVESTLTISRNLGLVSIAEGIETEETAELLTAFGCNVGQGYHFARPMPASAFGDWMRDNPLGLALGTGAVASD